MFRRLIATSRAPQIMVLSMLSHLAKLGHKLTKYGRGCPAGTTGHPESGTPSKVRSRALVSQNNQGKPPFKTCESHYDLIFGCALNFSLCVHCAIGLSFPDCGVQMHRCAAQCTCTPGYGPGIVIEGTPANKSFYSHLMGLKIKSKVTF